MSDLPVQKEFALVAVLAELRDMLAEDASGVAGDIGIREHLLALKAAADAELERMRADHVEHRMKGLGRVVAARSAAVADRIGAVLTSGESENHTPNL